MDTFGAVFSVQQENPLLGDAFFSFLTSSFFPMPNINGMVFPQSLLPTASLKL